MPFHQWRFDANGTCVHVPFARAIPPRARMRKWPTAERGDMIFVWHDLDGRSASLELPRYDESTPRLPGCGLPQVFTTISARRIRRTCSRMASISLIFRAFTATGRRGQ